jgi:hypothetical protein
VGGAKGNVTNNSTIPQFTPRVKLSLGERGWVYKASPETTLELECEKYTVQVKNRKSAVSGFLTRTVYFNELDERDKYTVRVKKPENVFSVF